MPGLAPGILFAVVCGGIPIPAPASLLQVKVVLINVLPWRVYI
jgi:hypothetical protein